MHYIDVFHEETALDFKSLHLLSDRGKLYGTKWFQYSHYGFQIFGKLETFWSLNRMKQITFFSVDNNCEKCGLGAFLQPFTPTRQKLWGFRIPAWSVVSHCTVWTNNVVLSCFQHHCSRLWVLNINYAVYQKVDATQKRSILSFMNKNTLSTVRVTSLTIKARYANIFVFIDCENNQLLKNNMW